MTSTAYVHLIGGGAIFFAILLLGRWAANRLGSDESEDSILDRQSHWTRKIQLKIVEIIDETHNIKLFRMQRLDGNNFSRFRAGQFVTFQIGDDSKLVRSYSIASPSRSNAPTLAVGIKLLDGGIGSQWFHERKVGDTVWAYPPAGQFTDSSSGSEMRVYIAGGIGVTPILSMIQTRLEQNSPGRMVLIYSVRTPKDLAFDTLFKQSANERFQYFAHCSDRGGHITLVAIKKLVTFDTSARFFVCGPNAMNEAIIKDLLADGVSDERIHDEKFVSPTQFDPTKIEERDAVIKVDGQSFLYSGRESLLDFLENNGVVLPSACRSGVCGSCKCQINGHVDSLTDAGLTRPEKQQGFILSCVSFPKANSTVEVTKIGTVIVN